MISLISYDISVYLLLSDDLMKFKIIFLIVLCATQSMCFGQESQPLNEVLMGLDEEIEDLIESHHAAGIAVAIIKDGKTIYSEGFGYRDLENKLPVDEHTVFGIGSCTKAFTACILGILADEGKLKFTDKPSKYLTDLRFFSKNMNDSIRIKNLLNHSTGINSWPSESTAILFTNKDKYKLIPRIKYLKPLAGVGEQFIYNNLMYTIAGMVAEKASGQSLEDQWKSKIFSPLKMTNTFVDWPQAYENENTSYGYVVDSITSIKVLPEDMSIRGAGGSIFSSVHDMSLWMQLWLDKGLKNNEQIFSSQYYEAATNGMILMPPNPRDSLHQNKIYYGYGWGNWSHNGIKKIEHSGGLSGYVSNVVLFPEENIGIVALSNQTTSSLPSMVTNNIIARLFPKLKTESNTINFGEKIPIGPIDTPSIPDSLAGPSFSLEDVVGNFYNPGYGSIQLSLSGETLFADFPLTKFRLVYTGEDTFIDYNTEEIPYSYWNFMELKFKKNDQKIVDKILINLDQKPVEFVRQK